MKSSSILFVPDSIAALLWSKSYGEVKTPKKNDSFNKNINKSLTKQ